MKPLYLVCLAVLTAPAKADTSINQITQEYGIKTCAPLLKEVAELAIKKRTHRIHAASPRQQKDEGLFNALGVVSYRDRDSHLVITAAPDGEAHCEATYAETFVLGTPCVVAREEVFKKWDFKGKLTENTLVLSHRKSVSRLAYLTPALDGSVCMVTTKQVFLAE